MGLRAQRAWLSWWSISCGRRKLDLVTLQRSVVACVGPIIPEKKTISHRKHDISIFL